MKFLVYFLLFITLVKSSLGSFSSIDDEFDQFKKQHNKEYSNTYEEAYRKGIFASNLADITKHNEEYDHGEHTWKMGVSLFADLTHAEFMETLTLNVPDMPKSTHNYQMQAQSMATSVDWRQSGCVTDVKDQGSCGSCWSFGAIASVEYACCASSGNSNQLSEQQVIDCDKTDNGCNGGWHDTAWQYMIEEGGVEKSSDYPYTAKEGSCKADENKFECVVTGCVGGPNEGVCDNSGKIGEDKVLKQMLTDQPLGVAVDASRFQHYSSGILDCGNHRMLNHAVFAVGYEGYDYYIVKNSWGKSWGESGYVRIGMIHSNDCGIADYPGYAITE